VTASALWRVRWVGCAAGALATVLALGGCHANRRPSTTRPPSSETEQVLLRLRVEGEADQGAARLRVVLRRFPGGFELRASDVLGRSLWSLRVGEGRALWLDLRERRACHLAFDRGARALGWPDLPWDVVPAILLGEAPVARSGPDVAGREWILDRGPAARIEGWRVSLAGTELARFTRLVGADAAGKAPEFRLESDRPPVVLTWSIAAREAGEPGPNDGTTVPQGFEVGGCDELRVP
jgi:hypothetical protein